MERLETLWISTGTLCNLACTSCYIESSPVNDALAYLSLKEAEDYFEQAKAIGTRVIGFTGGEPFMNPDMVAMMRSALARGFELLVLTNAMRPMQRFDAELAAIAREHGDRVVMRVSIDHPSRDLHEAERGADSWQKALDGLVWLARAGFRVAVAGRRCGGETEERAEYNNLFYSLGIEVDHLVLFPTMDAAADVPEITEDCWDILHVSPDAMMCASSRMVVRQGDARHTSSPALLPMTRGSRWARRWRTRSPVPLNHPIARVRVLGGASCSG
jgi:MoaA/NifB/PqqE/SkfB family radical SAM enzyme